MKKTIWWMRGGAVLCLVLHAAAPTACDSRSQQNTDTQDELRRQQAARLQAEQAARLQAEQAARAAEVSRGSWIVGLSAGACAASLVVLLIGVGLGSRVVRRYRKEHSDE